MILPYILAISSAGLVLAFGVWVLRYSKDIEPNRVEVTRHTVTFPDLPPELDGLRICQVSDVHLTAHGRNEAAVAAAIRSVEADLFVLTGDMIYQQAGVAAFLRWFDDLGDAIRPAVAIFGNAEHKKDVRRGDLVRGLCERAVPLITNGVLRYPVRGTSLQIVGTDDPHTSHCDMAQSYAEADPGEWTLLLTHSPDGLAQLDCRRADLVLCGHTHGGQVCLPIVGALATNTHTVHRMVSGWYEGPDLERRARGHTGTARVYVTRGLGMSGFPHRLLCPPELPVFTLRRTR